MIHSQRFPSFVVVLGVICAFGATWTATGALAQSIAGTGLPRASLYRDQVSIYANNHGILPKEAAKQLEWQRLAPTLQEIARRRLGSHFGGVWIDHTGAGRVKLGVAHLSPNVSNTARAAVATSGLIGAVDIVGVPRSETQLLEISDWLDQRISLANTNAQAPLTFGLLPDQSAVRISLPHSYPLTLRQEELVQEARHLFGPAITTASYTGQLRDEACSYPFCSPPLRAGIRVGPSPKVENPALEGWCTGGFLVRGKETSALYQLTAGHCDLTSNGETTWGTKHSTAGSFQQIGAWAASFNNASGDAGMYTVANDAVWNARPWVYWYGSSEGYPIFSDADPVKGQEVCKSGAFHGTTSCGVVTEVSVTVEIGGIKKKVSRANYCSEGGDSGSPVHYYGVAYGVHTGGSGTCNKYFTHVRTAEEKLNVNVRHESECDPLFESPVKTGDMTGDGKEDIFQFTAGAEGKTYAWESKGTSYTGLGSIGTGFGSQYQNRVGDMDGDGDDDLFQMTDEGNLYAWESKGTSYTYLGKIASGFGSACDTRVAHINGDSKVDVLRFTNDGYAYGWLDNGAGYEALGQIGTGFGSTYQDRSGDMDGDGDDDLFQILDNGTVYRWISNGSTYTQTGEPFSGVGNASQVRFADTEGDGDDDIFRFTDTGVGTLWKSKGTAYEAVGTIATGLGTTRQMRVADIDADGDADILKFADDGNGYAWRFNGSTYESIGKIGSGFGAP